MSLKVWTEAQIRTSMLENAKFLTPLLSRVMDESLANNLRTAIDNL